MISRDSKIYIAGHKGMVGSAILRKLNSLGYQNLIVRDRHQLDLAKQVDVEKFFEQEKPEYVFIAAAKVGGILANHRYPAEFINENLSIQSNLIHSAYQFGCTNLMFLGSSCIYPKYADQPIQEISLLKSPLEPTNEFYAIAKIAGLKMCEAYNKQYGTDYRCLMPTNLYGPNDNFHPENSHVIPGLISRIFDAKNRNKNSVSIWGNGKSTREFLHVDDLADACCHVATIQKQDYGEALGSNLHHLNVGTGKEISICELSKLIAATIGYSGKLEFDRDKPDGTPQKLLDVSKLSSLGWRATTRLEAGLRDTYEWFLNNQDRVNNEL